MGSLILSIIALVVVIFIIRVLMYALEEVFELIAGLWVQLTIDIIDTLQKWRIK